MMESKAERNREFFKMFKAQHPTPYFLFKNLESTDRLDFELLDDRNYINIYRMFKDDPNPFISEQYKDEEGLKEYMEYMLNYNKYSPKKGACDWLVKLKSTDQLRRMKRQKRFWKN